ncbi:MAG: hypothetical protein J5819_02475 [Eubacterium sp.]|nr:hypothetical protein [Eubacterium sp.]
MESVTKRKTSITGRILFIAILFLSAVVIVQAVISTSNSRNAIISLMQTRMLNVVQSAAAQINGDDFDALDGNITDASKPEFRRIVDVLDIYEKNVTLDYIYGVKALRGGYGVVVEDDLEGEDEFGEPIYESPALQAAMNGTSGVDDKPDEDRWGRVYTAFAPVYNSQHKVSGLIAVDFNADSYDSMSTSQTILIVLVCVVALAGSLMTVLLMTGSARRIVRQRQIESENLREIKHAVDSANEAKSHFLDHVSQETRVPIHAILDKNNRILNSTHVDRTIVCANGIQKSAEQLMTMVNNVLEYSAIEADRIVYEKKEYDIVSVIYDIVNTIRPRLDEKDLGFYVNVDDTLPRHLFGDYAHISQCIVNLLVNAVEYTSEGEVTLSVFLVKQEQSHVFIRFSVEDTGVGISDEDKERLFEPFERVESNDGDFKGKQGTGLGLAVVQSLLKHMGSSLDVESLVGAGSIFSFTIEQRVRKDEKVGNIDDEILKISEAGGEGA